MSKIGVILPSRGLMFSKTAEELLKALKPFDHKIYFSHRKPIPECFEDPLRHTLENSDIDYILMVEDDMILPENIIADALALDKDVVTCDYPINERGRGAILQDNNGKIIYCGTGFLLIKRHVFDKLKKPYFRTDIGWNIIRNGKVLTLVGNYGSTKEVYGLHDVTFGIKLNLAGIEITKMDITLGQRKLISLGKSGSNDGAHNIQEWTKVKPDALFKKYSKSAPESLTSKSKLITLNTLNGTIQATREHSEKLINAGIAIELDKNAIYIDSSAVDI